ncbi:ABC transporter ATP-binding protein [Streptomyces chartreusis]|uniref:ABC transporter ATP-binding protein n=1 Tax=Streptomyces chartreusis TaxID=1969 RepID=UPI0036C2D789
MTPGRQLLHTLLRPTRPALTKVVAWSMVESLPILVSGAVVAAAIDHGFLTNRLWVGLGWLAVLAGAMAVRAYATRRMVPVIGQVVEPMRDALIADVVTSALTTAQAGKIPDHAAVTRITRQVELARSLTAALLRSCRELGLTTGAALVGLFILAPLTGALTALPLAISLFLLWHLLHNLAERQRHATLIEEQVGEKTLTTFTGLRDVIACRAEDRVMHDLMSTIEAQAEAARAVGRAGALRGLIVVLGVHIPLVGLLAGSPWLIHNAGMSAGEVVGAATYLALNLEPALRSLSGITLGWGVQLAVVLNRLALFTGDRPAPTHQRGRPEGYDLYIRGITFAFAPHAEPVLSNLELHIPQGEHLAVVGPSGIGKSTLANLLTATHQPQRGDILLHGMPLNEVADHHIRRDIALVPQEAYIFRGTLRANLTYLAPDQVTDADLDQVVHLLGLNGIAERLGGYDAIIADPQANLSSGERQLITLARIYISPARVIVLDEATSHLEPMTEARVEAAFAARHGTLIIIAHRISSAMRARRVLVLDGANATVGTHEELMHWSPLYANLVGAWTPVNYSASGQPTTLKQVWHQYRP